MKGYRSIPVVLAMLAAGGCSIENPETHIDNAFVPDKEMTFTAGFAAPDTKTEMHGESAIWWTPGDEICIWFGSSGEGNRFTSQETESTNKARFTGTINSATGVNESGDQNYFLALYPFEAAISCDGTSVVAELNSHQVAKPGSFAPNTNITLAKSPGLALSFYNVCSGIRFSVTHEGIKSVTFRGNDNEDIAGTFSVSMGENGKPTIPEIIEGQKEVTLSAPSGQTLQTGHMYYLEILPQTLAKGFTITFYTDSEVGSRSVDVSAPFERSVFSSGVDFDRNITYVPLETYKMPDLIDLGLSVKWAAWNVGASSEEEYGDLFSWGELSAKDSYAWSNYRFGSSSTSLTKYCLTETNGAEGFTDGKKVLEPEDDIASALFGDEWRIPTKNMVKELIDNCTWTWKTIKNVKGYLVTSKINRNSIFLPASGYRRGNNSFDAGSYLYYWTSNLTSYSGNANGFYASSSAKDNGYSIPRYYGVAIRPVYGSEIPVESVTVAKSEITLPASSYSQLGVDIYPSNATNKSVTWSSSNTSVAKVSEDGVVTAVKEGTAIVTVRSQNGGMTSTCAVTVISDIPIPTPVDLGLSAKWASTNVGAVLPEDYGSYYAWGEIETKQAYSWGNYKWGTGTEYHFTKYNYDNYFGDIVDNLKVLTNDDDVATQKLGGRWHTPTISEIKELISGCDWEDTIVNGVKGFLIRSRKNSNSIFLPLAGYMSDLDYYFDNFAGFYWSSSLLTPTIMPDGGSPMYGCAISNIGDGYVHWDGLFRSNGLPVRAVYK